MSLSAILAKFSLEDMFWNTAKESPWIVTGFIALWIANAWMKINGKKRRRD